MTRRAYRKLLVRFLTLFVTLAALFTVLESSPPDLSGKHLSVSSGVHSGTIIRQWIGDSLGFSTFSLRNTAIAVLAAEAILLLVGFITVRRHVKRHDGEVDALRESEWFAKSTVDALSAQIAVLDSSGCILAVNRTWRDMPTDTESGIARAETGTNYLALCDTLAGRGNSGAGAIAEGVRAVATGQRGEACAEYERSVGSEQRWYLCRITRFPGNVKTRIVIAHEDITARKRAEEAADNAKHAAEAANKAKTAFLANMSHEIRTPMTAIIGYGDLLLDEHQSAEDRGKCVQVIRRNGEHLLCLINDVLDISKIEANKYEVECARSDLRQLLSDVVALTRVKAIQKGLNFKVVVDGPVPREIRTDPMRLKQILVNLIGNAVKFTSRGGIYLRVACQDRLIGSTLHVDVIDTGIGMSREQIGRLFKPFTQADESTTRQFGGTGLGLVISRRFAQLLGGDIAIQSEPGCGSCFSVWVDGGALGGVKMLPALDEADLSAAPKQIRRSVGHYRGRVLVAEDGEDNQQLISLLLRNAGVQVVVVPNGRVAINYAITQQFDLILMDMLMPEMDGYTATRRLRDDGYTPAIVALTANAMADDRAKCIAAGCDDYLPKPIRLEQLQVVLDRYLKRAEEPPKQQGESSTAAADGAPAAVDISGDGAAGAGEAAKLHSSLADSEKFRSVLERFVARLPERIEEMRRLLREQELHSLARAVHQMKGAAGGYGFPDITMMAGRAEDSIKRAEDIDSITAQVEQLVALIHRVDGFPHSVAQAPAQTSPNAGGGGAASADTDARSPNAQAAVSDLTKTTAQVAPAPEPAATKPQSASRTHVDPQTGLPNRNNLLERLSAEIDTARRQGVALSCLAIRIEQLDELRSRCAAELVDTAIKRFVSVLDAHCQRDLELFRLDGSRLFIIAPRRDAVALPALVCELSSLLESVQLQDLVGDWKLRAAFTVAQLGLTTPSAADLVAATVGGKTVAV